MPGKNRSYEIYETLSRRITTWNYPPGHRLTEEHLCGEFSASRSPVREALNMLVEAGLMDKQEHRGYVVRKIDIREINELYDTRIVLEEFAIRIVCMKGLPEDILLTLRSRWETLLSGLPAFAPESAREDELFHETIVQAAGNSVIQRILKDIDRLIHVVRLSDITDEERLRRTCQDHLAILDAIEVRDVETAQRLVRKNIEWGKEKVDSAIREALLRAHGLA